MTQRSQPWDGTTVGDAATRAPYGESEWDDMFEGMFDSDDDRGVLEERGLELVGSIPGANLFQIATGEALVKGKWHENDANVVWTVPSASGGNWRRDRIVLSCSWDAINLASRDPAVQLAQTTRLIRLINPAENAAAPAMTKTDGVLWEIALYRIQVSDAGVVTIHADDREFIVKGGVDAAHNHEGGDGAALGPGAIIDRTRTFFVPAIGTLDDADDAEWQGYELPDADTSVVYGYGSVPEDFVGTLTVRVVIIPAASGDIFGYFAANYGDCAELWNIHNDEYNAAYQAVAVTLNQRNCIMQFALANAAVGDMIALRFNRDATDGADDIDDVAYCPGFLVSYTADS